MALLALRGCPQKPSQSRKGYFSERVNAINHTESLELEKSAKKEPGIFVIGSVDKKQIAKWDNLLKNALKFTINKACLIVIK